MRDIDYWRECMSQAAESCGLTLTNNQLYVLAECAEAGHEMYGMAHYSPPASDRIEQIRRDHDDRLRRIETRMEEERTTARAAILRAYDMPKDAIIEIHNDGSVERIR